MKETRKEGRREGGREEGREGGGEEGGGTVLRVQTWYITSVQVHISLAKVSSSIPTSNFLPTFQLNASG